MKKMLTGVSAALCAALCGGAFAAGLPEAEFRDPSVANRPETWFHFIGGNVAKPGIIADLEAIKGVGISGIHLFHGQFGGKWPGVEPQITCLSASWDGLVGFVADECRRLGLTFTMQNCPGWAMSGGPWIKPENAMRHLIWKRIDVEGGKRVEVKLPKLAPSAPPSEGLPRRRRARVSRDRAVGERAHVREGVEQRQGGLGRMAGVDGGLDSTLIRANGRVHSLVFNPYTKKRQAWMCGEAPKFQSMMRQLERTLAGTGLDGVYMDMIACAAHMPCFNPRHRHAPGGGTAVIDGYRDYVRKVHEDNPRFILSSETPSESYLDLFEAFILPHPSWERVGYGTLPEHEAVPATTVIYRGAAVLFGSYATPGGVPAWDPLWGVNPDKPDVEEIVAKYPDQFVAEVVEDVLLELSAAPHAYHVHVRALRASENLRVSRGRLLILVRGAGDPVRALHEKASVVYAEYEG